MRLLLLLFPIFIILPEVSAKKYFRFTPKAKNAYDLVTSLRFEEANSVLARLRLQDPDNLIVHHIENYMDFFRVYLNEDEEEYKRLKKNRDRRLDKIEQGDPSSPYYLFIQADIRLQWALLRLRFEEYLGAFSEVSKAHKLLIKNEELFPNFMANQKDLAILHAMVGTIPDNYKWGVKLLSGLSGTFEQGRREMEEVIAYTKRNDFIFEQESYVLYAFLLLHLGNEKESAWKAINDANLQPQQNPLHCFLLSNIAMRTERNNKAIQLLENRPTGAQFHKFPYLDFMLGLAKLRRLDSDAKKHFQQYVKGFHGKNFIKEAYQKMAWQDLLNNNLSGYKKNIQYCLTIGNDEAGGDKNALKEAEEAVVPDISLLKARLLFDGGYFDKAFTTLQKKNRNSFTNKKSRLEYEYRLGRILHGMERYPQAIQHYENTINSGQYESYFFACNAALQIGLIYEKQGNLAKAKSYYKKCLDLNPDEYKTGLHQKAKAGLARLK